MNCKNVVRISARFIQGFFRIILYLYIQKQMTWLSFFDTNALKFLKTLHLTIFWQSSDYQCEDFIDDIRLPELVAGALEEDQKSVERRRMNHETTYSLQRCPFA